MKKRNIITLILTSLWAVLAGLNESGLLDVMPIENEKIAAFIKWVVAVIVVIVNAVMFKIPQTGKNN